MVRIKTWNAAAGTALALVLAVAAAAGPETSDWPAYRGPDGTGISRETGLKRSWPAEGPREIWRVEIGDGYSGIAASGGRVFTLVGDGRDEFALCLDAATGKEIWKIRVDAYRRDNMGGGPRSTPTVDGEMVYVLGARGILLALRTANGGMVWEADLKDRYGARVPQWGVSTSPLVEGEQLIVDAGGKDGKSLVALDKKTGETRWTTYSDKPGYSTPLPVTLDGVRQIVSFAGTSLVSVSPVDGKVLWSLPWSTAYDVNAAMPLFVPPNGIFVSSSYDKGAALLRPRRTGGSWTVEEVWRSTVMKNHFNSSILYGGHLYGFDDGTLKCIKAETGEEMWKQRGFEKGSLLLADGLLVILGEKGTLALARATPESYQELARSQVFEERTWTMPSLAGGRLFLRDQAEMVALAIAG